MLALLSQITLQQVLSHFVFSANLCYWWVVNGADAMIKCDRISCSFLPVSQYLSFLPSAVEGVKRWECWHAVCRWIPH